jgi:hypothetical protein
MQREPLQLAPGTARAGKPPDQVEEAPLPRFRI